MAVAIRGLLDRMIPKYCYVRTQRHGPSRLRPGPWKAGVVGWISGRPAAGAYERLKTATVSAWLVCGNMSTIASDSMR